MRQSTQLPLSKRMQQEAEEDLLNVLTRVRGYSTAATFIRGGEEPSTLKYRLHLTVRIEHIGDCHIKSFNGIGFRR